MRLVLAYAGRKNGYSMVISNDSDAYHLPDLAMAQYHSVVVGLAYTRSW